MFAMCQLGSKSVVTLKISEILFKNPAQSGDILEFWTRNKKVGRTSLTVECVVTRKRIGPARIAPELDPTATILSCEFVFVLIGSDGKPVAHGLKPEAG